MGRYRSLMAASLPSLPRIFGLLTVVLATTLSAFADPIPASVSLNGLAAVYDGTSKSVTATTDPAGLAVDITYDGSSTPPTNAGSYAVIATVNDPSYTGSASGALIIAKATAVVNLSGLSVTYDGTAQRALVSQGVVSTYAGTAGGPGSLDGTGSAALFNYPQGVAVDSSGNIFIADFANHTIRKVTPAGVVTTIAGTALAAGNEDGVGSAARFYSPGALAFDGSGNLYVADSNNHAIRKISPAGVVTTIAGSAGNTGTADGTGSAARFFVPDGIVVDGSGYIYVADTWNHTIRKISPAGVVTTLVGSAGNTGTADGTGSAARFNYPRGLALDTSGNLYVADQFNYTIRKVTNAGVVTTIAGQAGVSGSADGVGAAARFRSPSDVSVDSAGNLYVADSNGNCIRKITSDGTVTTLAGNPNAMWNSVDGIGLAARFKTPRGLEVDSAGNIYVADSGNYQIRKVTAAGVVTTLAGIPSSAGATDGAVANARFSGPWGAAFDTTGNLYITDSWNHTVRKITPAGVVTTLAGSPEVQGSVDGTGSAARFTYPTGIAVNSAGDIYVSEENNHTIRKITPDGVVTTLAGSAGQSGSADGTGATARFSHPGGLVVGDGGNIYVNDGWNRTIRKITPAGVVTTLAGAIGEYGHQDGVGSDAIFGSPIGIAWDGGGYLYVTDAGAQNYIRKVAIADGTVTTVAGGGLGVGGTDDGVGNSARFSGPFGITMSPSGDLYVTEVDYLSRIRRITPDGTVTTVAGTSQSAEIDGIGTNARFYHPTGIAINGAGNLFVTDYFGNTIRKITGTSGIVTLTYNGSSIAPTAPGSYSLVATLDDPNYQGSATGTLVIAKAPATVTLGDLAATWDGVSHAATATTSPSGKAVNFTYDGSATPPTQPGSYAVVATIDDPNYAGSASGTLVITDNGPVVTSAPAHIVVGTPGQALSLAVTAISATNPLAYQWRKNNRPIAGATAATLNLPGFANTDAGTYTLEITAGNGLKSWYLCFVRPYYAQTQVVGWGSNGSGETVAPYGPAYVEVAVFGSRAFGLTREGGVVGFGAQATELPHGLADVVGITNRLVLKSDGSIAQWDPNVVAGYSHFPLPTGLRDVVSVQTGATWALALKADGTVVGWGNNDYGVLNIPAGLSNVVELAVGSTHVVALKLDGTVAAWGANAFGPGVDEDWRNLTGVKSIKAGDMHTTVLKNDGQILHSYGGAGGLFGNPSSGPVMATAIVAGGNHSLALTPSGAVVGWGDNWFGQTTVPAAATSGVAAVFAGPNQSFALRDASDDILPAIATNPVTQTRSAGQTTTFSVTATGYPTPTYQWQIGAGSTWQNLTEGDWHSGATSATLTIAGWAVSPLNGVQFRCIVTNPAGSATSNPATLIARAVSGDFTGDGKVDMLWQETTTGQRYIWQMDGFTHVNSIDLGYVGTDWSIAGAADFDLDGHSDILWQNTVTGQRYIWFMRGVTHVNSLDLGFVGPNWSIAGTADFNGDGYFDILWQEIHTGQRYIWFMQAYTRLASMDLGYVGSNWTMVGTADFNSDGHTDILWQEIHTGQRYIWFMHGAEHFNSLDLGYVGPNWSIAGTADFTGDGQPDILWQETTTGQRYIWQMDGFTHVNSIDLGFVGPNWSITN
jgi:sugar lactone lactonase YvrE